MKIFQGFINNYLGIYRESILYKSLNCCIKSYKQFIRKPSVLINILGIRFRDLLGAAGAGQGIIIYQIPRCLRFWCSRVIFPVHFPNRSKKRFFGASFSWVLGFQGQGFKNPGARFGDLGLGIWHWRSWFKGYGNPS